MYMPEQPGFLPSSTPVCIFVYATGVLGNEVFLSLSKRGRPHSPALVVITRDNQNNITVLSSTLPFLKHLPDTVRGPVHTVGTQLGTVTLGG